MRQEKSQRQANQIQSTGLDSPPLINRPWCTCWTQIDLSIWWINLHVIRCDLLPMPCRCHACDSITRAGAVTGLPCLIIRRHYLWMVAEFFAQYLWRQAAFNQWWWCCHRALESSLLVVTAMFCFKCRRRSSVSGFFFLLVFLFICFSLFVALPRSQRAAYFGC